MDEKEKMILSLLKDNYLSNRQKECLERYSKKDAQSRIEAEVHVLPPPQTHLIRIYQRRFELAKTKRREQEFLKEFERILALLKKWPDAKVYILEIDCDIYTDNYFFIETGKEVLKYMGVLWGPRIPAYAKQRSG